MRRVAEKVLVASDVPYHGLLDAAESEDLAFMGLSIPARAEEHAIVLDNAEKGGAE